MGTSIAVAGKGGTGKTTTSALIIRTLVDRKKGSVLALDADPNSNLDEVLGIEAAKTIGSLREDFKKEAPRLEGGVYKDQFVEMNVHQALVESKGFDLLVMGRGEGQGCYCYANNLFKNSIDILQKNYDSIVMDNEAGMEHLSRRTTSDVDFLLIISDPSPRGIKTAARIKELSKEVNVNAGKIFLVVGRVEGRLDSRLSEYIRESGLDLLGIINSDPNIYEMEIGCRSIFDLPAESPALKQVGGLLDSLGI